MAYLMLFLLSQFAGLIINFFADWLPAWRKGERTVDRSGILAGVKPYLLRPRVASTHLLLFILALWLGSENLGAWSFLQVYLVVIYFIAVSVIDIEHHLILNATSWAGALISGIIGTQIHGITDTFWGAAAGFALVYLLYLSSGPLVRVLAKKRGELAEEVPFGFGDVNLAAVIGLLLGWPGVIAGLFLGFSAAGLFSLLLIVWRWVRGEYHAFATIPLGPFLCFGALLAILLGAYV